MSGALGEKEGLALRVIDLAKAQALADNHFLAAAMGRLRPAAASLALPFATDGRCLAFDAERVLSLYVSQKEAPKHDLMHSVLHCVFVHPYVGPSIDVVLWGLACDMVVERNVAEICGPRSGTRGTRISRAFSVVESELGERPGAEKLYKALKGGMWADEAGAWRACFSRTTMPSGTCSTRPSKVVRVMLPMPICASGERVLLRRRSALARGRTRPEEPNPLGTAAVFRAGLTIARKLPLVGRPDVPVSRKTSPGSKVGALGALRKRTPPSFQVLPCTEPSVPIGLRSRRNGVAWRGRLPSTCRHTPSLEARRSAE